MSAPKTKGVRVGYSMDRAYLVLTTPPCFKPTNIGLDQPAAERFIADVLAVYRANWPEAPPPRLLPPGERP